MKRKYLVIAVVLMSVCVKGVAQQTIEIGAPKVKIVRADKTTNSQWNGKSVAFLGDSMTDKHRAGMTCLYWEYLSELLGIKPFVYGISGNQWNDIYKQAVKLQQEKGTGIDAILIFAGTNDYNRSLPIGDFFTETTKKTIFNGNEVERKYRTPIMNDTTFCGRINKAMSFLKNNFPQQQIIIMTPIHRGYAKFNERNVQPDENYSNGQGLYIDNYVEILKKAAEYWAVPLIDLFSLSGLYPLSESHLQYFHDKETDRLHPNSIGNYRLARTIQFQLLALPSQFVTDKN